MVHQLLTLSDRGMTRLLGYPVGLGYLWVVWGLAGGAVLSLAQLAAFEFNLSRIDDSGQ